MKQKLVKFGNKIIEENSDVFVIAEAGVNHNGRLDLALKLVDVAAEAGADAVKFQTYKTDQVVTDRGEMAAYQMKNLGFVKSQKEMLRDLELKDEFYTPIIKRCKDKNIIFMSTPHGGKESVDFLESLKVPIYKIGSGDLTNYILLEKVAKLRKPIVLSSGMATMKEVKDAISFVKSCGCKQIVMLHCTTNYPCPDKEVNLAAMITMMKELDVPVGYSDHTLGNQVAIMATTLGVAVYECHFTLDKSLPGPDHVASASPDELKKKILCIRNVKILMGSKKKDPNISEIKNMRKTIRKSIVITRDLDKGEIITKENLEAKRPGDGTSPKFYKLFLGKRLKRAKKKDEQIFLKDID